jgi:hypothetical protein
VEFARKEFVIFEAKRGSTRESNDEYRFVAWLTNVSGLVREVAVDLMELHIPDYVTSPGKFREALEVCPWPNCSDYSQGEMADALKDINTWPATTT